MSVVYTSPDADLILFHRGDSPKLYCRLRRPDGEGWIQRSTRCLVQEAALKRAREWHDELRFRARLGLSADPKQFAMVADRYLDDLRREIELGLRPARHLRDYAPVVSRYLKPFFGRMLVDEISSSTIEEYRRWREAYWLTGPGSQQKLITYERAGKEIRRPISRGAPSRSTLIGEDVVLRGIFHTALKAGFVRDWQVPAITRRGRPKARNEDNRRAAFTLDDYRRLYGFMQTWAREGWPSQRDRRRLLKYVVHGLVQSGMRPGTESDGLRWCDIEPFNHRRDQADKALLGAAPGRDGMPDLSGMDGYMDLRDDGSQVWLQPTEDGVTYSIELTVSGKTGRRSLVPTLQCQYPLSILRLVRERALGRAVDPEERVFCLPDGTFQPADSLRQLFKPMLEEAGLLHDKDGRERSLYSCRHTYATFSLLYRKVPVHTLARNMGTSVAMIERHYNHLTPRMAARDLE